MVLQDFVRNLKKASMTPSWEMYVEQFPTWMTDDVTWPTNIGVRVSFAELEKATEEREGKIIIYFIDEARKEVIRKFLRAWEKGAYDVTTNTSRPWTELKIAVALEDVNNVERPVRFTLKFPTSCDYVGAELRCQAEYFY
ncbi:hypothetical protein [Geomonas subterranea]|uniref:hypothetical protein n=1 Tax=Geomonas subterranea TaxID=2847989 RepID=UPI001CD2E2CD|nr:hypothetical protein [Geomonas fuzhouensis]